MYKILFSILLFLSTHKCLAENTTMDHLLVINYKKDICYKEIKNIQLLHERKKNELYLKASRLIDKQSSIFIYDQLGKSPQDDIDTIYENSKSIIDINNWQPVREKIIDLQLRSKQFIYFVVYNFDLPVDSNDTDKERATFILYEISCNQLMARCVLKKIETFSWLQNARETCD